MLACVEIENKDGVVLMSYRNPKVSTGSKTPTYAVSERKNEMTYKGYFACMEDEYIAQEVLSALIRNIAVDSEAFVLKKHATVYSYIDNYLTARNPAFAIPRKRKETETQSLSVFAKKKVYVEVADTIEQRVCRGRIHTSSYGRITARPTQDIGSMSLKIDSRSLCGMRDIHMSPLVSTRREGVTTLLTSPSRNTTLMTYTFECNESSLPVVKIVLIDAKSIEVMLCFDTDLVPESFSALLTLGSSVGSISIECKKGKCEYVPQTKTLSWKAQPTESTSLIVRTAEPHRGSVTLKYSYMLSKTAMSSVLVNSLASEADESWIKYTTSVSGLLRAAE